MKYTIKLYFPMGPAYPSIGGGFDADINKRTRFWDSRDIAIKFAEEMCGKYGYDIVEVSE